MGRPRRPQRHQERQGHATEVGAHAETEPSRILPPPGIEHRSPHHGRSRKPNVVQTRSHRCPALIVCYRYQGVMRLFHPECEPSWNKDPVFGVISIQSGPPGQWVHSGFHGGGSQVGDAGSGDDR
jgi:hypothetical protein